MKEIQQKIKEFCKTNNLTGSAEVRFLDCISEMGEVSKEILKMTNYGSTELKKNQDIDSELGDVLFSLITLANTLDTDLESALNKALEKYKRRLEKGSAGSEVE